ncbi:hypothetical protein J0B03_08400 [Alkalibacter rhizosphaerae]|uniref:tRNA(Ile2) 2-agmatinylcytidine synthetase n=1 Tax=Alkalibacter rhizosphaerae TaxID=2815577 RepID=A0A974XDI3_9FIRM|nr:hypothetical protein [Alkalibacter rhizosphaerae]QSX07829.1 hypothetical protein J0B03_08400 [Alkalibacter rhizosphaerae]
MKLLLCIDDTDNLESIGTGELLENLCKELEGPGWARTGFISRHQLYVHEDIPYTSHNSSMCTSVELEDDRMEELVRFAREYLIKHAAEGSDPGLCILVPEKLTSLEKEGLMEFGQRAKIEVLDKNQAYDFAKAHEHALLLSEHGGTGDGIIGALAGCGLRMYGSDGRLKGKIKPQDPGEVQRAKEVCERYGFGQVLTEEFEPIPLDDLVMSATQIKPVLWKHEPVVLVEPFDGEEAQWRIIEKNDLNKKRIGR